MKRSSINHTNVVRVTILTFFVAFVCLGSAQAGDDSMQHNLNNLSELTAKWSQHLSSGNMTPQAQMKLSELLSLTSQVLKDMGQDTGGKMNMEHRMKIEGMQKAWNPFDSSDKM